jgi:hypothetical protein
MESQKTAVRRGRTKRKIPPRRTLVVPKNHDPEDLHPGIPTGSRIELKRKPMKHERGNPLDRR